MMQSGSDHEVVVDCRDLEAFAVEILTAADVQSSVAAQWSAALVWADLRGVESHGVSRLPQYVAALRTGEINAAPQWSTWGDGAVAILDADRAPGVSAMLHGIDTAMDIAERLHIGWCSIRNMGHGGAIGYIAELGARRGMAIIAISASIPTMAYHGTNVPALGTNPLAIAFPTASDPLVLDMSTATAAYGKILLARAAGLSVPAGWGLDSKGAQTTDPNAIMTLLPVGGTKGSGLSLMMECLASVMTGNALVARALEDPAHGVAPVFNAVVVAIEIGAFGEQGVIREDAERLRREVHRLPAAVGVEEILLPGERGQRLLIQRRSAGIPIVRGTWQKLMALAAHLSVTPPPQRCG